MVGGRQLLGFWVCIVDGLDDSECEEEGDEEELHSHLEEGQVYVGIQARRSQHLLVGDSP